MKLLAATIVSLSTVMSLALLTSVFAEANQARAASGSNASGRGVSASVPAPSTLGLVSTNFFEVPASEKSSWEICHHAALPALIPVNGRVAQPIWATYSN